MQLIVNADDLGAYDEVNDAVFDLMDAGLVTSATLIANGPRVQQACVKIPVFPRCSFGVHLNVTEFPPLTSNKELTILLDENGAFENNRISQLRFRIGHTRINGRLANAIYEEFCAQIERLISLGVKISHIDSHHNVHTIPTLFPILKQIQKRFAIRKVRISQNIFGSNETVSWRLLIKSPTYNFLLKRYYKTQTTQGFTYFRTFHEHAMSGSLQFGSIETMVHPGSRTYSHETDLLRSTWRESVPFPVRLISYHELT